LRRVRTALVSLALLLPAACQPPPQPFRSFDPAREQPLSAPASPAGVLVRAVIGAPHPVALAEATARALTRYDVVANTGAGNLRSWLLTAVAETTPTDNTGVLELRIRWDINDNNGRSRGAFDQRTRVRATEWAAGAPALLHRLAAAAAMELAPRFADANAPGVTQRTLTVSSVDGAPGDGGVSLKRALDSALRRRGFHVTDTVVDDGIVIAGTVRVSRLNAASDEVRIAWTAMAPDGAVLGTVEQRNSVPAGSLSRRWGRAASDVAEAAAPGIARLIARAQVVSSQGARGIVNHAAGG
jgi:hypothetical protein